MDIGQTVTIPADRRLHLDFVIPPEIPTGDTVRVELIWSPKIAADSNLESSSVPKEDERPPFYAALEEIWELTKDSPLTVDEFHEMCRQDKELEEKKYQRLFPNAGGAN